MSSDVFNQLTEKIEKIKKLLTINTENLASEACENAMLLAYVGKLRAQVDYELDLSDIEIKRVKAELFQEEMKKKIAIGAIETIVYNDVQLIQNLHEYAKIKRLKREVDALYDAAKSRSFDLKTVTDYTIAEVRNS